MKRNAVLIGQAGGLVVALLGAFLLLPLGWWLVLVGVVITAASLLVEVLDIVWLPADPKPSPFVPVPRRVAAAHSPLSGLDDALDGMD